MNFYNNAVLIAGESFFSFSWHIVFLCHFCCRHFPYPMVSLSSPRIDFRKGPVYITRGTDLVFIPLMKFSAGGFGFKKFSYPSYFFLTFSFISVCLIVPAFNIRRNLYSFFPKSSHAFLISQFYSIRYFYFSFFHYKSITFSIWNSVLISWLYIFIVYLRHPSFFPS